MTKKRLLIQESNKIDSLIEMDKFVAPGPAKSLTQNQNGMYRLNEVLDKASPSEQKRILRKAGIVAMDGDMLHYKLVDKDAVRPH